MPADPGLTVRAVVHLTGSKSLVTGDFYRYHYLAATLTGSSNRCFSIQNLKIQK